MAILDDEAGVELLDRALRAARPADDRVTGDPETARRLAGMCGGLPLALIDRPGDDDFLACGFVHIGVWGQRPPTE